MQSIMAYTTIKKKKTQVAYSALHLPDFVMHTVSTHFTDVHWPLKPKEYSLNSRDLFLNLRRLVKMTKPLRFENKSLRLKYKCLICIWIIFWAILDLFINPKSLFQNKIFFTDLLF